MAKAKKTKATAKKATTAAKKPAAFKAPTFKGNDVLTARHLSATLAGTTEITAKAAKAAVDSLLTTVAGALYNGAKVRLDKIGILHVKTRPARPARMGRNPFTGEQIKIKAKPATRVVKFRPARDLKEKVAKSK